jgi:hypothetical protein
VRPRWRGTSFHSAILTQAASSLRSTAASKVLIAGAWEFDHWSKNRRVIRFLTSVTYHDSCQTTNHVAVIARRRWVGQISKHAVDAGICVALDTLLRRY